MTQELILIRGLPGSGKSTFAARLAKLMNNTYHYETDMFFNNGDEYEFHPTMLKAAHEWCQQLVRVTLQAKGSVIVSNTFSRVWEMQPYLNMAKEFGAKLTVIEVQGDYGSVHGVPEETINKMKARWEKYP